MDFGTTLTTLGLGLVGAVGTALVVAWYLPHIPYANRLMLAPPADDLDLFEEGGGSYRGYSDALRSGRRGGDCLAPGRKSAFRGRFP